MQTSAPSSISAAEKRAIASFMSGAADMDESMITGESRTVRRNEGATVVAGTDVPELGTWVEVMKLPDLRTGSPVDTSTGDAPIIGALAAVDSGEGELGEIADQRRVA